MNAMKSSDHPSAPDRGRPHPRVWLLSAYAAPSHRAWARRIRALWSEAHWHLLELPGRHFRWRIRGNPLSWLDRLPDPSPDLLVATSMVDLATLRGLHPRLARVPALCYFHENQFAYPSRAGQHPSLDPQMVQLYAALAANRLAFNSAFNRDSFLDGIRALLARMPDEKPSGVAERLAGRSLVLPVPVDAPSPAEAGERDPRLIGWNHRWEYDKDPDRFADAILALADRGREFRLALLGIRHRNGHPALERLRRALPERIVVDETPERESYLRWLGRIGIAVSTTRHEFQGLSMLEAAAAGARPLVPDALCYPECFPQPYRYPPDAPEALVDRLEAWLEQGLPPQVSVAAWSTAALASRWREALQSLTDRAAPERGTFSRRRNSAADGPLS